MLAALSSLFAGRAAKWAIPLVAFTLLLAWLLRVNDLRGQHKQALVDFRVDVEAKMSAAFTKALLAKQKKEQEYVHKAQASDAQYQAQLSDARTATQRYIDSHRVRPQTTGGAAGRAVATAEGADPGLPAEMPASAVLVSEGDVQACTEVTAYAISARDWAISLEGEIK